MNAHIHIISFYNGKLMGRTGFFKLMLKLMLREIGSSPLKIHLKLQGLAWARPMTSLGFNTFFKIVVNL